MSKRFKRTRSSPHTQNENLNKSTLSTISQITVNDISVNTIIPFVNSKYEIKLRNSDDSSRITSSISLINLESSDPKVLKLCCNIIFNLTKKMGTNKAKSEVINALKRNLFKQRIQQTLQKAINRLKNESYQKIIRRLRKNETKISQKILQLSYIRSIMQYRLLSDAFRKISIYSAFKNLQNSSSQKSEKATNVFNFMKQEQIKKVSSDIQITQQTSNTKLQCSKVPKKLNRDTYKLNLRPKQDSHWAFLQTRNNSEQS